LKAEDARGYSNDMDADGYYTDPRHPSNRPRRSALHFGRDATKLRT
jgi:hypothetical protein